ncbi:MAG: hypothetical protein WBD22_12460 [Pyrinomonadaceae bacterium]
MATPLVLSLDGEEIPVTLVKIDREKLYGGVEIEAFDEKGHEATLRVLAADGKTLIDKGGTALTPVGENGASLDRTDLVPVDTDGNMIDPVASSFASPNILMPAESDDYLSQIVKTVYHLQPFEGSDLRPILDQVSAKRIYSFPFSYRGGVDYDTAYVLGSGGDAFMVVGRQAAFQFVTMNQSAVLDAGDEQEISTDEISFDLL